MGSTRLLSLGFNVDKKKRRLLIFSSLFAMAFYALSVAFSDHEQITAQLKSFTVLQLCLIFGLSLLNYAIRFIRWHGYLNVLGHHIPIASNLMYYLAGCAFTTTPGKAGEAIRSVYLKQHDVGYKHSLAMLVTERILDIFAMLILAGLLIYLLEDFSWGFYLIAFLTAGLLFLLSTDQVMAKIRSWLSQRLQLSEKTLVGHFLALVHQSLDLMKRRLLLGALVMGVFAWGAEGVAFYYILEFLGADISLSIAIGIYAASMIAGAISFIPGGLGSAEAAMGGLLVLAGVPLPAAIAATLVCRIATLWVAVVIGIISMLIVERKYQL